MAEPLERAWREERASILASLARRLGDLSLAEDAVQEAFAAAARTWPRTGVPDRPGAWLTTAAWRRALDVLRRERRRGGPALELDPERSDAAGPDPLEPDELRVEDDRLRLILTCCHASLPPEARVALTLRHVAGLTTREVAAALLVEEAAMAKRLVRARAKIRDAGIGFALPEREVLPERLAEVQAVIYLIFTEGHLASGDGPAIRTDLCDEAVWLAQQLHELVPNDPETTGLLALLLLLHARTPARLGLDGVLVPFAEQDRGAWDHDAIARARGLLAATGVVPPGPYQVEAAIALLHAAPGEPNWPRIVDLYRLLAQLAPSPVVELNRAVAVGHDDGPLAGLALLKPLVRDRSLRGYPALHAAHAALLELAGQAVEARAAWDRAAAVSANARQRATLGLRAAIAPSGATVSSNVPNRRRMGERITPAIHQRRKEQIDDRPAQPNPDRAEQAHRRPAHGADGAGQRRDSR